MADLEAPLSMNGGENATQSKPERPPSTISRPIPSVAPSTMLKPKATYKTGVCDCHEDSIPALLDGLCCAPCILGHQYHFLTTQNRGMNLPICLVSCCGGMICGHVIASLLVRNKLKERYNIDDGTPASECIGAVCCTPCQVCHTTREMTTRGDFPGGVLMQSAPDAYRTMV
eukprot:PhM_4_TR5329/c0_g1_i1/m.21796